MTAIGVGILFAVFAYTRNIKAVIISLLTTITIKAVCALYLGGLDSIINSSLAVILEGGAVVIGISLLKNIFSNNAFVQSSLSAIGIFCAGILFYIVGSHLAPCPYLKSLSASQFLLHETIPWAALSAATAPLGFSLGIRLKLHNAEKSSRTAPALVTTACCWAACALTVVFS
jgi:hypothetical protein